MWYILSFMEYMYDVDYGESVVTSLYKEYSELTPDEYITSFESEEEADAYLEAHS